MQNTLFYGDNLDILRDHIPTDSVDLIYLDPPFNSSRSYNLLFKDQTGKHADAQITAFHDTWTWGAEAAATYNELVTHAPDRVSRAVSALRELIGTNEMMAYLVMMAARLVELHRVLKPTGSLYLHCDPTASHYLKVVLDAIFGIANYRSEITWLRSRNPKGSQHAPTTYSPDTDTIFYYGKSKEARLDLSDARRRLTDQELREKYDREDKLGLFTDGPIICSPSMGPRPNLVYEYKGFTPGPWGWRVNPEKLRDIDEQGNLGWTKNGQPYRKLRPWDDKGVPIGSCWTDISSINPQADERLGYPTQKPLALLKRIICASSNPGDVVLDPFCGCGTAIAAAQELGRCWVGIDITHLSIALQKYRLESAFGLKAGIDYSVIGEPQDEASAQQLAQDDKYQFQWWALSLVRAKPLGGSEGSKIGKKGSDRGVDGIINFFDDAGGKPKRVIVQVKGGKHIQSGDIGELVGTVQREGAALGVFITLEAPTRNMVREANSSGFYHSLGWNRDYPRIQILTIAELLAGKSIDMPPAYGTFKEAERVKEPAEKHGKQPELL